MRGIEASLVNEMSRLTITVQTLLKLDKKEGICNQNSTALVKKI